MTRRQAQALSAVLAIWLAGCSEEKSSRADAQAIVIGAGLAGLSAAVEMGRSGVDVLVVDMNSVAGGHAVLAGGVTLVGTPVQERAGIVDSPDLAYRDWMAWTDDGDPEWTRYYAENSRGMIYDWVTEMGVEFVRVAPAHGNSVPRFHFTRGRAVHLVLPIFRTALGLPNVSFRWNARAQELLIENGRVAGVVVKDLHSGEVTSLRAEHVVLATGGFESDLERVLANWTPGLPRPDRLLIGSAISATGSGHDMAGDAGAAMARINRHYIYINGVVSPRDPRRTHALTAGNDQSMWVNAEGRRFTNETGFDKDILVDLLNQPQSTYWAIFDQATRNGFAVRGAAWLKNPGQGDPILDDPQAASQSQSLAELAVLTGLPAEALEQSVRRFNALVDAGEDTDFGRFSDAAEAPAKIALPPFYAVQMFPMTRKSMGGVAVDRQARALDHRGEPFPGLYAVGELNGSVGINGKHGLDGMFLGPAILTGRLAGRSIAGQFSAPAQQAAVLPSTDPGDWQPTLTAEDLEPLLAAAREGFWHFRMAHELVRERSYDCSRCHSAQLPFSPPGDRAGLLAQTRVCTVCH